MKADFVEPPTCGCGAIQGSCDCLDRATEPAWYPPVGMLEARGGMYAADVEGKPRRVRCGYCGNNPFGRNPECNRPIHRRAS